MAETGAVVDPFRAYNWRLDIGNAAMAYFTACSGPGVNVEVIKWREAGNRQIVRNIPGMVHYEPITLYYGLTTSRDVFDWLVSGVSGRADRRNVSIIMLNSEGNEDGAGVRWNLEATWVASWRGPRLDSLRPESPLAMESVVLVFDRLTRT